MTYLAPLDYDHLDNGVFLTSLAHALSRQGDSRRILIHGESAYTERIIQTGVMREEARKRCIKDLNNRLIALFADQGVSTIGLNGYQRKFITLESGKLGLDHDYLGSLPAAPVLLLSNLVYNSDTGEQKVVDLPRFLDFLRSVIEPDEVFLFCKDNSKEILTNDEMPESMKWEELEEAFRAQFLPEEFSRYGKNCRLTTARAFERIPDLTDTTLLQ